METRNCDECKHFNDEDVPGAKVCEKNHKPRWYAQKSDNPHDTDYGYRRKCKDYEATTKVGAGRTAVVTRKMLTAAHGVTLESGDVVLSARLLERIFLAMDAAR